MSLKVIELYVENYMRVKAVSITPDGYIQIVAGDNAQGKTSVINALFAALWNASLSKEVKKPIREGENHALVRLEIGEIINGQKRVEYIVTREWKESGTTLKLEAGKDNGAKYPRPQEVLDGLMSKIAFDPLAFIQLKPDEQVAELLKIVHFDINVEALDVEAARIYEERTEVGRTTKSLKGQLQGLGELEDAPGEEVSVSDLVKKYTEESGKLQLKRDCEARIAELEKTLASVRGTYSRIGEVDAEQVESIKVEIDSAEETNNKVRRNQERNAAKSKLNVQDKAYATISTRLDAIDKEKADALARAKFPIEGLSFTVEDGAKVVTFNGIPLSQIARSEQIRVALSIAMSGKPELAIARISDGSLLDDKTLAMIEGMAKDQDFQLWVERISDEGSGVVISDGSVKVDYSKGELK